ncbi:MAG: hypothetical protein QM778_05765 [Myxococcales bacterium]
MQNHVLILALLTWLACLPSHAHAQADAAAVVLVGDTQNSVALEQAIAELLQREGVTPAFTSADRFAPEALLAEPDGDGRVHVFITLPTPLLAKLYLRGPHGKRFILRELALRSGTDELGCESIAQVVATSSRALLHSTEGVDRETARANLARDPQTGPSKVEPELTAVPTPTHAPAHKPTLLGVEFGLRANAGFSGDDLGPRLGLGIEFGLSELVSARFLLRERVVFEQFLRQNLHTSELTAQVRTSSILLGVDLGIVAGQRAFLLGLSTGADLMHIAPDHARDGGWSLAKAGLDSVPILRCELRFERTAARFLLAFSAYGDTSLIANSYQVRDGGKVRQVASPWRVTPGLAFTLGWHSR